MVSLPMNMLSVRNGRSILNTAFPRFCRVVPERRLYRYDAYKAAIVQPTKPVAFRPMLHFGVALAVWMVPMQSGDKHTALAFRYGFRSHGHTPGFGRHARELTRFSHAPMR